MEPTLEQWRERALVAEALLEERTQECESLRVELEAVKPKDDPLKGDKYDVRVAGYDLGKDTIWEQWGGRVQQFGTPQAGRMDGPLREYQINAIRAFLGDDIDYSEMPEIDEETFMKVLQNLQRDVDTYRKLLLAEQQRQKNERRSRQAERLRVGRPKEHDWKPKDWLEQHAPKETIQNVQAMWFSDEQRARTMARIGFMYGGQEYRMEIDKFEFEDYMKRDKVRCARMIADAMADKLGMTNKQKDELAHRLLGPLSELVNPLGRYQK